MHLIGGRRLVGRSERIVEDVVEPIDAVDGHVVRGCVMDPLLGLSRRRHVIMKPPFCATSMSMDSTGWSSDPLLTEPVYCDSPVGVVETAEEDATRAL